MANSINNLNGLALSALNEPNDDEGILDDLKFDQAEAFVSSQIILNKLQFLLYPVLGPHTDYSKFKDIFDEVKKTLPLNPSKFIIETSACESDHQFPTELTTQILFSIFQLLIRNEQDGLGDSQTIKVSINENQSIAIQYIDEGKTELFADLAAGSVRYKIKSKFAFEYEFLRMLLTHPFFSLKTENLTLYIALTY